MELYRVVVCLFPSDDALAASFLALPNTSEHCQHIPLPDPRAKFCCRPRRTFYKVLRPDSNHTIQPRKTKELSLPASFWTTHPAELRWRFDSVGSLAEDSPTGLVDIEEVSRQIHRLADYFSPSDVTKQLEMVCCFSNPSLVSSNDSGYDSLFAALLRMAEYQESIITFLAAVDEAEKSQETKFQINEWLGQLGGRMVFIDKDRPPFSSEPAAIDDLSVAAKLFWRGGVRFPGDKGCRLGSRIRGLELVSEESADAANVKKVEYAVETVEDYTVPLAASRWLECWQEVNAKDVCLMALSNRRWSLRLQSPHCEDARHFLQQVDDLRHGGTALLCRLQLYSAQAGSEEALKLEGADSDYMPGSERWVSQILNDLRQTDSDSANALRQPPAAVSLPLLLLPALPDSSRPLPGCHAVGLRLPWELPLSSLLEMAALGTEDDEEDEEEQEESLWRLGDDLSVLIDSSGNRTALREVPTRPPTEAQLRGCPETALLAAMAEAGAARRSGPGPELGGAGVGGCGKEEGAGERRRASSETGDHLVEQILRCFRKDGRPALPATSRVKASRRPLVDKVDDPALLHWPMAANTFFHGIDYNRGAWCEDRAERLAAIQRECIQHETMCTVTRLGCRGNAASCAIPVPPPAPTDPCEPTRDRKRIAKKSTQTAGLRQNHRKVIAERTTSHASAEEGHQKSSSSSGAQSQPATRIPPSRKKRSSQPQSAAASRRETPGEGSVVRSHASKQSRLDTGALNSSAETSEKKVPRSARHDQKLQEVVAQVLRTNGITEEHPSFSTVSDNLFDATKTMIKLQRLPNSRNLAKKMMEVAQLQYDVIKKLVVL